MSAKAASRPDGPAIKGKVISRSRSTKPALMSCRARDRLPQGRHGGLPAQQFIPPPRSVNGPGGLPIRRVQLQTAWVNVRENTTFSSTVQPPIAELPGT